MNGQTVRFDGVPGSAEPALSAGMLRSARSDDPVEAGDLRYLAFSNMPAADVVHYPDSGKVLSFAMNLDGMVHISRLEDAVGYYDGED